MRRNSWIDTYEHRGIYLPVDHRIKSQPHQSLLLALSAFASAQWPHLRTTYGIPGISGFDVNPRTQAELEEEGWVLMESCADGNSV